jgi:hypothetical protein
MRTTRTILASALVLVALAATALPAGAGQAVILDDDIVCNTATGEYDLEFTITNMTSDPGSIVVNTFDVDGVDTPLTFSPNPVPGGGSTSVATTSVPGTTTTIFLDIGISFPDSQTGANFESTLDGDCEPDATTTTTTSTTVAPTTTTVAPAARAVARTPAFTG